MNFCNTSFYNTWQELEELYRTDFTSTGDEEVFAVDDKLSAGLLYHFYADLSDLLNSLETGIIYSTKNDKAENKAQFDYSDGVGDGTAYVCMTNTIPGKTSAIKDLGRPFGLSFSAKELADKCSKNGSKVRSFDAWGAKGNYGLSSRNSPYLLAQTKEQGFNPFSVHAIGELPSIAINGEPTRRFFISGGQSTQSLWSAKIFYDAEVYKELQKWFEQSYSTGEAYQKRMFYHFENGDVGEAQDYYKGKPIKVTGNKNTNYKPFPFKTKDGEVAYDSSMSFTFTGTCAKTFVEVIGYGPFQVKDENGDLLLGLSTVNANAQGNYRGPFIFGKNISDSSFSSETKIRQGQSRTNKMPDGEDVTSIQQHLMADKDLFDKLSKIYDEHEYRIYLPGSQDFRFAPDDIETLVLPEVFRLPGSKEAINLVALVDCIKDGSVDLDNFELLKTLGVIETRSKKAPPTPYLIDLMTTLVWLLTSDYNNVGVEFIPNSHDKTTAAQAQATLGSLQKTGEADVGIPLKKDNSIPTGDRARKVVNMWPELDKDSVQLKPGQNGETTAVARIHLPDNLGYSEARIGSEAIIIAEDDKHNKFVLFVYKSKSPMFMELPGGGFGVIPAGKDDFKQLLLNKLAFKCNIDSEALSGLEDTGKALLLYEIGVAKDASVTWPWSYYRLYTAKLKEPLSGECLANLGYTFDNTELAKTISQQTGIDVHSYRAHLRWVPVKNITMNRAITDRYSNIIPLIKELANQC
jgi:hypothetical protein